MKVLRHLTPGNPADGQRVVTFGAFDGVHLGHQRLLARLVERARESECEPAVLLFVPAAKKIPEGKDGLPLTDLRQRLAQLAGFEIPIVVLVRAPQPSEPAEICRAVARLLDALGATRVLLGEVLEVGTAGIRAASLRSDLRRASRRPVEIVPDAELDGHDVGCETVRQALLRCDFEMLQRLLGRPYGVGGRVIHGHHRGRQIGVPTVNLHLRGIQLPPDGVFAVRVTVDDRELVGVANIGYKPTFGDPERTLEAHLLDFAGDLYGRRLVVRFTRRIRSERKFPDIQTLVEQIQRDIEAVRELIGSDG